MPSIPAYMDSYYDAAFASWMPTTTIDPATLSPCPGVSPAPVESPVAVQDEVSVLLEFKAGLNESATLERWDQEANMCTEWEGVSCDASGHLTSL